MAYSGCRASSRLVSKTVRVTEVGRAGWRPGKGGRCCSNRVGSCNRCKKWRTRGVAPTSRDSRRMPAGQAGVVMITSRRATRRTREEIGGSKERNQCEKILAGLCGERASPAKIFYASRADGREGGEEVGWRGGWRDDPPRRGGRKKLAVNPACGERNSSIGGLTGRLIIRRKCLGPLRGM